MAFSYPLVTINVLVYFFGSSFYYYYYVEIQFRVTKMEKDSNPIFVL